MNCIKCGNKLSKKYKSEKYCSKECSKNYLRSQYRKRNREKINAYNRDYKSKCRRRPLNKDRRDKIISERGSVCARCSIGNSVSRLQVHHIKPLNKNGKHDKYNLLVLCFQCHMEWERIMKDFWY